ncbi:Yft2p KNAG_0C05510 [Huiozyma naganishii CBS 8797]|uniref:Acyl-coenzyme A diphosphatase YFT2 n=1 Tax=Huiozyma naganishii (strain ATCC MYA-139 / BCRC 22969 / CBS 8797 / KCTC 17520 / NBRC 10181 / NCYC 3082 / Yp74L-3) TaxID=1071383 RepID=J7S541_HUIN7|nr:hypothetical protein KNAG_0C05510 [Kazachstania naganishii CBS 8797]CCK69649.1 hypothetical protein KNAG_0C05510 [Kazachstania naganishii CBS 8797]
MLLDKLIWPNVVLLYPFVLSIGLILHVLVPEQVQDQLKQHVYFFNSKNVLNQVFAYKGNLVWTVLFLYIAVLSYFIKTMSRDPLEQRAGGRQVDWQIVRQYCWKLLLKNGLLYLCFLVIDGVFIATGGVCTTMGGEMRKIRSAESCKWNGGQWENGFDISGHFCFLMNISLILWAELQLLQDAIRREELGEEELNLWICYKWLRHGLTAVKITLYIWLFLLFVTASFYHTSSEKLIGCAFGYVCPFVMYHLIPTSPRLNEFFYG